MKTRPARAHGSVRFPARFMLVAAMNPTPKGASPHDEASQRQMERYLSRISGPLIDRVDIHVEVPPVPYRQLTDKRNGTTSAQMREQVIQSRRIQSARNGGPLRPNRTLTRREPDQLPPPAPPPPPRHPEAEPPLS